MAVGLYLHLAERHRHEHTHEPIEHDHGHIHDEHHQHRHSAGRRIQATCAPPSPCAVWCTGIGTIPTCTIGIRIVEAGLLDMR